MLKKIEHMMQLQDEMNTVVHPQWKEQSFEWNRAAWIECAELMDHIGWKWWKKQEPNIEQAKLELVDIWHFILSECLTLNYNAKQVMTAMKDIGEHKNGVTLSLSAIEELARCLLHYDIYQTVSTFSYCCDKLSLSFDDLYKLYIGKNVLNKFRQANGYNQGTYIKIWFGKEDNDYLYGLLGLLDENHENFMESIEKTLTVAYQRVVEGSLTCN